MADPCDADLAVGEIREERLKMSAKPLGEERRDEDLRQEVALVPAAFWAQPDAPSLGGGWRCTAPFGARRRDGFAGSCLRFFHGQGGNSNPLECRRNE